MGLQRSQMIPHRSGTPCRRLGDGIPQTHLVEHLVGRSTAVISHSRDPKRLVQPCRQLPIPLFIQHVQRLTPPADRRKHQCEQLRSATAAPPEQTMGERLISIPSQLVGAEPTHTCALRNSRQTSGETEAVGQPGQSVGPLRKDTPAVGLPQVKLLPERRTAEQHAIRFNPRTIDRFPAAGSAGGAHTGEQRRPMTLQPFIQGRGRMSEMEFWPALQQLQGRAKGSLRGLPGVGDRPEPGQIQMGVTKPVHRSGCRLSTSQMVFHCIESLQGTGIQLLPLLRQTATGREVQLQCLREQDPIGIRCLATRLQIQTAADQSAVIVQRAAQLE